MVIEAIPASHYVDPKQNPLTICMDGLYLSIKDLSEKSGVEYRLIKALTSAKNINLYLPFKLLTLFQSLGVDSERLNREYDNFLDYKHKPHRLNGRWGIIRKEEWC